MVDREVDVPVWVVLGRSCGLCWRSWAALGAYVGGLGPLLGPTLAVLGRSWGLCWWPRPEKWLKPRRESDPASIENVEDKVQGLYMLPVNFSTDHPSTI